MQISSRFTIALHIFACIDFFNNSEYSVTSDFLAKSIQVNPVIIRNILLQLKAAGLIHVSRGRGGNISLARSLDDITFFDVYNAVECVGSKNSDNKLFHFHENPNPECPVGRNIHAMLDGKLERIQTAMENEMRSITLADAIRNAVM